VGGRRRQLFWCAKTTVSDSDFLIPLGKGTSWSATWLVSGS
jgi:hypothetical protein